MRQYPPGYREQRRRDIAALCLAVPRVGEAVDRAAWQLASGEITDDQFDDWMDHLAEPVVLCPWCHDWEEVGDAVIRDGRMWCCSGCDSIPERRGETPSSEE